MSPMLQTLRVKKRALEISVSGRKFVNFVVNRGNLSPQYAFYHGQVDAWKV
jgi:hypothetical protein